MRFRPVRCVAGVDYKGSVPTCLLWPTYYLLPTTDYLVTTPTTFLLTTIVPVVGEVDQRVGDATVVVARDAELATR